MIFNDSSGRRSTLGAVILLALFAIGCGSSTSPTSPISPTNPEGTNPPNLLTVTIRNGVYSPNPVAVKAGQTVNWLNSDAIAHSATDPGVFDTGSIAPTSAHSDWRRVRSAAIGATIAALRGADRYDRRPSNLS